MRKMVVLIVALAGLISHGSCLSVPEEVEEKDSKSKRTLKRLIIRVESPHISEIKKNEESDWPPSPIAPNHSNWPYSQFGK